VRWGVLSFTVAMAVILYLDRMAISVPMSAIAADLNLEITQVGDSVAAFFWCYALCQIPAGWLGDRWGGRRALTLYVAAWSLAMGGLAMAGGLTTLLLMRGLLGVGQAGAYATTAGILRHWIPFSRRGFANSAVSLGGRAGGVLAPALTSLFMALATLAGMSAGRWRPVFAVYAAVGLAWSWIFWRWFRDQPGEHPRVNRAELAIIDGGANQSESKDVVAYAMSPGVLLGSRSIWFLALVNFWINVGWILVGTLLPTYLIKVHGQSEIEAGFATSLVALAGMAGCLAGGLATDLLVHRLGLTWGRRAPCLFSYGGAALVYGACFWLDDPRAIVTLLVIASFLGDFGLGPLWCTYQDIGGAYAGTVLGTGNMCGNIGAALASSFIPRLAAEYGWSASFALSFGAYTIGALGWLGIDPHAALGRRRRVSGEPAN
jgi:sugar phosphate permease